METGTDFLRGQVSDAVMLHRAFIDALGDHGDDADDPRFSELCARYMPIMLEQQRRLDEFQKTLGAGEGLRKKVMGRVVGAARELADVAREDDYLRLIGDLAMSSMAEASFRTFREAGRMLGNQQLAELGAMGEREHDDFNRDANRLAQAMFVEHVRAGERRDRSGAPTGARTTR